MIVLDRTGRYQIFAAFLVIVIILFNLTPPAGLRINGYHAIVLFGATIFLWVSELLPIAVTALLSMVMLPLLGIMDAKSTYAQFGNEAVFFILAAFILAAAMTGSGLSARLARAMLARFGRTPRRLALTVFLLSTVLSYAMSEHAVAAMMFPVVSEIVASLGLERGKSRYGGLLFMAIAWGCIIGGIGTFLGGARAPLAASILRESTGHHFSFGDWMIAASMIVLPLVLVGFPLLLRFFPLDVSDVGGGMRYLNRKRLEVGKMGFGEYVVALVMAATIVSWMTFGEKTGLAAIAILASVVLFTFRVVSWASIEEYVNWGIILMYGGSIALAGALEKSGAASWIVNRTLHSLTPSPFMVIVVISFVAIILTECVSHAAVVAIFMPIGLPLAASMGMDPKVMTLSIALPAGLAYCLPMGTPAMAIAYGSGFLRSRDIIIPGALIMLLSWLLFLFSAWFIWPLIGLKI
ncbi:DASS family sodium-coupled anion symporter [Geobacter sp. AOG2]|uniref:SLC13 family permease n=1 Tax=Geobacter sp. AOG2 TaxID=1566347 RepID=UPI001CC77179|nr:DASS family sodium-coupled anion symporter [Geobacter sp. AOG2]GFE60353.1 sodium/dicarboxylate or sulfate cotransporter [Geobacter sp. AOG2]